MPPRGTASKPVQKKSNIPPSYSVIINYNLPLDEMIAAGNYDWMACITAKQFSVIGKGIVEYEAKLFHFNRNISSEKVIEAITSKDTANPWKPGKIEHLLAFGKKYPYEQRKYPIFALGSSRRVRSRCGIPFLSGGDSWRALFLSRLVNVWDGNCWFLAVRKVPGS